MSRGSQPSHLGSHLVAYPGHGGRVPLHSDALRVHDDFLPRCTWYSSQFKTNHFTEMCLGPETRVKKKKSVPSCALGQMQLPWQSWRADVQICQREFFIDNLLVRIHLIIEMILVDRPCAMGV